MPYYERLSKSKLAIAQLISEGRHFQVKASSYTKEIKILDTLNSKGKHPKVMYANNRINLGVFGHRHALLKHIEPHLEDINYSMSKRDYEYFYLNDYFDASHVSEVYNIDINSAYLCALYNEGLVPHDLYLKISELPKKDRLVLLGLLAYEPEIFTFKEGQLESYETRKNDFKNAFFLAVYKTSELMLQIKQALGREFIFSWVDGVYFLPSEKNKSIVEKIMKDNFFSYSFEKLNDLTTEYTEDYVKFTFFKEKEKKEITVPTQKNRYKAHKSRVIGSYFSNPNLENTKKLIRFIAE